MRHPHGTEGLTAVKTMFNITTCSEDLGRFADSGDLLSMLEGFDGVELMCLGEDEKHILPNGRIIGLHMGYFPYWLDFWNGDTDALAREFDTADIWRTYYGGSTRDALIQRFQSDMEDARRYGAEYVVFHVSDCSSRESFTLSYRHSDGEVIDAACELLNELLDGEDGSLALLLENLWQPGLTFTRADMTARLLEGISYPNKGVMLDTGHLLHTNTALRTQEEGLAYINAMLDAHGALCSSIRGIHLNQSLTGEYCERVRCDPPVLKPEFSERYCQMFQHAFNVDKHLPFTCEGVDRLVERIAPEYLTFEFITESRAQHREYLDTQRRALKY